MTTLQTTAEVIDALGGNAAVARLLGVDRRVISNWRGFDRFPPKTFVALNFALAAVGCVASPALWPMMPFDRQALAEVRA